MNVILTDGLEEAGMSERQLNHLFDLGQLLPAASNVVVPDGVESVLLFFPLDRIAVAVDHRVGSHDAKRLRVRLDHFEFDGAHASTHDECVALRI